jgi:hypothetical protein
MTSTIKVNNIQNQCGANIANKCGSTVTLGASGDTITLACGASQTGFGRTGTVDWDTTAKTASFTAVSGNGYFVNTTSGAITVTLPASPSAGDIVGFNDYARNFETNNLTIARNGSLIQGVATDATISTNGQSTMFVYVDGTQGWIPTEDQTTGGYGAQYVTATGGTVTCCGDFKIHTFTGPGTFTVTCAGNAAGSNTVSYVVVAGAGGGGGSALGYYSAGGGGAGGFREGLGLNDSYTGSPLRAPTGVPVTVTGYPITVGGGAAGGTGNPACGSRTNGGTGSNSVFSTITSAGGGGGGKSGGSPGATSATGQNGGSGGGGGGYTTVNPNTGTGNTPPVSPPQGNPGGAGSVPGGGHGGGGGGATTAGTGTAGSPSGYNNAGGAGATTSISTSPVTYGVGGNAGADCNSAADAGTTNRGNGGQGGNNFGPNEGGAAGGSGIVIIRYKFQ